MLSQIVILDKAISRDFNDRDVIMFSAFDNFKLNFRQLDSLEQWYRHKWIIRLLSKNVQGDQLGSIRIESSKVITENPKYNALICCYTKGLWELIQTAQK